MAINSHIKRSRDVDEYSTHKIHELKKCKSDPVYFLKNYVIIKHPTKGPVPFELFPFQERAIRTIHENKNSILLYPRQMGKTTLVAMYMLWLCIFHDTKNCIIASKNLKHATEIMSRIKYAYEELPSWIKSACKFYNRTSIEFMNGSVIKCEATSENTGRGDSPSMLMVDECAFLPRRLQEAMWASLTPALSTGGKFVITSTPNGDDDLYANLWRSAVSGINNFVPIEARWDEHPDRGPEYLAEMMINLGELKCRQEVLCEFLSSESLLVDAMKLATIKASTPLWEFSSCKFWVPDEEIGGRNKTYLVSLDPATGSGNDFSVIEVFEFPSMKQIAELRMNDLIPALIYARLKWVLTKLLQKRNGGSAQVYWTFERNGVGEAISALYWADDKQVEEAELYSDHITKFGVHTTESNKIQNCLLLKRMIERVSGGFDIRSQNLLNELKQFASKGKSYAGKPGMTDDCVMACVGIVRLLTYISGSDDRAFSVVNEYIDPDASMMRPEDRPLDESGVPMPFAF